MRKVGTESSFPYSETPHLAGTGNQLGARGARRAPAAGRIPLAAMLLVDPKGVCGWVWGPVKA